MRAEVGVERVAAAVAELAAKQRIVERLSSGDVRVLAGDVRAELEELERALGGAGATVVALGVRRRGGA